MKKFLTFTFTLAALSAACFCISPVQNAYAQEDADIKEFAQLEINELAGYAQDGATVDPKTGNITSVVPYGRFGYNGNYENVEITSRIKFSTTGNTVFTLRAQGDSLLPIDGGWANRGYNIRWYATGQYDFLVDGNVISSAAWGMPVQSTETEYNVKFKTVNTLEGNVHVTFSINGSPIVDYLDSTTKIAGGWYAVCSEGSQFSATGKGFQQPLVLNDLASPVLSANFPATLNEDGTVSTSGVNSGAGFVFQTTDTYSFKTYFTPKTTTQAPTESIDFTIGAYKTNDKEINRPDVVDSAWGWTEPGYTIRWCANGQRHILRGGTLREYVWHLPTFTAGQTYEIEYGVKQFADGSNQIFLKIDGNLCVNYFDRAAEDYTPLKLNPAGGAPASHLYYAMVITHGVDSTLDFGEKSEVTEKTTISNDLDGLTTYNPASVIDRNGNIASFGAGIVGGYNANFKDGAVKFKTKFTSIGTYMVYTLRSQGGLDTPWGGDWTNRGYTVYLYPNGQIVFAKNGATLFEGWATGGFSLATGTEYTMEFGTINRTADVVQVYFKVNGVVILNYVDSVNALNNAGWFSIYNDGFSGTMAPCGVEIPILTTTAEAIKVGESVTLTSVAGAEYFIDEDKSTATASLSGNVITAKSAGKIVVYAKANNLYSSDLEIEVTEELKAVITSVPSTLIVIGGEKVKVDGGLNKPEVEVTSKEFSIENLTGRAVISANGEITGLAAGTVKVFVTINGLKSEGVVLTIIPKVEVGNTTAMAVGETRMLSYSANGDLPSENIITKYEIIEGGELVTLNTETGEITANRIGIVRLRVTLTGESFQAVSVVASIAIEKPVVVLKDVDDMYVGQTTTFNATINEGVEVQSSSLKVVKGGECVTIDGMNVTAIKEGSVEIRAVINGIESASHFFIVDQLVPTFNPPKYLTINDEIELSVMFNYESYQPSKIEYSLKGDAGQFAEISSSTLKTLDKAGKITVVAKIYDSMQGNDSPRWTVEKEIEIMTENIRVVGLPDAQDGEILFTGKPIILSFAYAGDSEITSVQYVLVSGNASLTGLELKEGETEADRKASLTLKGEGTIKVKVIVNGVESPIITVKVAMQGMSSVVKYLIVVIVILVTLTAGITTLIIVLKKRKKKKLGDKA